MNAHKLKPNFGISPPQPIGIPEANHGPKPRADRKRTRAATEPPTEIAARIDVGLGNTLFIRGQGDGLNWDKGRPLVCQDATTWVWSSTGVKDKLVFKLLLNDIIWSQGEDIVLDAGKRIEVVPSF